MRPSHSVSIDAVTFASFDALIDVRSPSEFIEDHVPGAISAPVLDDAERAQIGTLYKQHSSFAARRTGAALISRNIARHLEAHFATHPDSWRPLVYCWRGGKRSASMTHVLREIGWDAKVLAGGYKAYRRQVLARLEELPARLRFRVVHGATGSGKSRLLAALEERGEQVLDLETLAAHRGSVLGTLPGRVQPSQKYFESLVHAKLAGFDALRPVYVEGESKKIGQRHVPDALMQSLRASECLVVDADPDIRTSLLLAEYDHFMADAEALGVQLDCLTALHGRERISEWKMLAARGDWRSFVGRLLAEHYDPAYRSSASRNYPRLAEAHRLRLISARAEDFGRLAASVIATESPPR